MYNAAMATVRAASVPRIVRNKRILGGVPIIRGTRVPVRAIAFLWCGGEERPRIFADYPRLTGIEVDEVISFYQAHRSEIDADLRDEQGGEDRVVSQSSSTRTPPFR